MKLSTPFLFGITVEEAHIHLVQAESFDGLLTVIGHDHAMVVHGEEFGKRLRIGGIIIDNEDIQLAAHGGPFTRQDGEVG
ncbi:MAG: hypothetical protein IPM06_16755 [Rhizobiales bacterium]|nr:hypothetical protein [Hyphomicrobiales bacterium]